MLDALIALVNAVVAASAVTAVANRCLRFGSISLGSPAVQKLELLPVEKYSFEEISEKDKVFAELIRYVRASHRLSDILPHLIPSSRVDEISFEEVKNVFSKIEELVTERVFAGGFDKETGAVKVVSVKGFPFFILIPNPLADFYPLRDCEVRELTHIHPMGLVYPSTEDIVSYSRIDKIIPMDIYCSSSVMDGEVWSICFSGRKTISEWTKIYNAVKKSIVEAMNWLASNSKVYVPVPVSKQYVKGVLRLRLKPAPETIEQAKKASLKAFSKMCSELPEKIRPELIIVRF